MHRVSTRDIRRGKILKLRVRDENFPNFRYTGRRGGSNGLKEAIFPNKIPSFRETNEAARTRILERAQLKIPKIQKKGTEIIMITKQTEPREL